MYPSKSLEEFIAQRFSDPKKELTLLEIGGPGYNLAHSLSPYLKNSFAINLTDRHLPVGIKPIDTRSLNHTVIDGDATDPFNYKRLQSCMGENRANLWIERIEGGWRYVIKNEPILFHNLRKYYRLSAEDSVGLIQLYNDAQNPRINTQNDQRRTDSLLSWQAFINSNFKGKMHVTLHLPYQIRIDRFKGSPNNLPFTQVES